MVSVEVLPIYEEQFVLEALKKGYPGCGWMDLANKIESVSVSNKAGPWCGFAMDKDGNKLLFLEFANGVARVHLLDEHVQPVDFLGAVPVLKDSDRVTPNVSEVARYINAVRICSRLRNEELFTKIVEWAQDDIGLYWCFKRKRIGHTSK